MKKIVIVDDDRIHLELLSICTFEFGNQVSLFATLDYDEALNFIENNEIEILITDYNLGYGNFTGMNLIHRAKELNSKVTTILVSAFKSKEIKLLTGIKSNSKF